MLNMIIEGPIMPHSAAGTVASSDTNKIKMKIMHFIRNIMRLVLS